MELHSPSWSHPRILLCSDSDGVLRVDDREGIDHILAMEEDEDVWPTTSDGAVIAESLIANSGYSKWAEMVLPEPEDLPESAQAIGQSLRDEWLQRVAKS